MARLRMAILKKLPKKYHSPAGRKYLEGKKKTTPLVSVRTKSTLSKLRKSGLSEKEIRQLTGR